MAVSVQTWHTLGTDGVLRGLKLHVPQQPCVRCDRRRFAGPWSIGSTQAATRADDVTAKCWCNGVRSSCWMRIRRSQALGGRVRGGVSQREQASYFNNELDGPLAGERGREIVPGSGHGFRSWIVAEQLPHGRPLLLPYPDAAASHALQTSASIMKEAAPVFSSTSHKETALNRTLPHSVECKQQRSRQRLPHSRWRVSSRSPAAGRAPLESGR